MKVSKKTKELREVVRDMRNINKYTDATVFDKNQRRKIIASFYRWNHIHKILNEPLFNLKDIVFFIPLNYLSIYLNSKNARYLKLVTMASQTQLRSLGNEPMNARDLQKIGLDDFLRRYK